MNKYIAVLLCLLLYPVVALSQTPGWASANVDFQAGKVNKALDALLVNTFGSAIANSVDHASDTLALQAPFAIGSGNAHSMSTSSYPGVKIGVGIGASVFTINPTVLINSIVHSMDQFTSNLSSLDTTGTTPVPDDFFSLFADTLTDVPIPYYSFYFKIGLPESSQFLSDFPMDVGFRVGFIPNAGALLPDSVGSGRYSFDTGGFNFGVEARMRLLKAGIFYTDMRLSADYSWREIGVSSSVDLPVETALNQSTQLVDEKGDFIPNTTGGDIFVFGDYEYRSTLNPNSTYTWSGFVFSPRLFMGIDIPIIGGIYAGAGPDINFGSVDMSMNMDINYTTTVNNLVALDPSIVPADVDVPGFEGSRSGSVRTTSGVTRRAFQSYDFRLITGIQLFFMNISLEYGVVSKHFAVTFYPFAIKF